MLLFSMVKIRRGTEIERGIGLSQGVVMWFSLTDVYIRSAYTAYYATGVRRVSTESLRRDVYAMWQRAAGGVGS